MRPLCRLFLILAALASPALRGSEPLLVVSFGDQRLSLDAEALAKLPQTEIEALDHGQPHRYRGVAARDVLSLVGAPLGDKLRGSAVALAVRARAADGYVAAFALAEFDAAFREQAILLVDSQDGGPLPGPAGPLRLVCPGERRGARWVRQVVSLEVISLAEPSPTGP